MAQAAPTTASDGGLLPPPPMLPQPSTQQLPPQQQPSSQQPFPQQQPSSQQPFPIAQMLPMPQTTVTGQLPPPLPLPQAATSQPQAQYNNIYPTTQIATLPQQPAQLPPPTNMLMPATPQPYFTQFQTSFPHFSQIIPQAGLPPNFTMGLQQNLQGAGHNTLALLQNIATTQMIGSLAAGNMLDPFKKKAVYTERRRHRSPSPKRRHRSRSESPRNRRSPDKRNGKRRRNRSPQHIRASPAKHIPTPPQITTKDEPSTTLYQPPTPPAIITVSNPEKTPEYKCESTPTTPDYSARSPTPEYTNSDNLFNKTDKKVSSNVASILSLVSKNVATVKPSRVSPVKNVGGSSTESRIVSLKKINEVSPSDPNINVKSLTDILREQALQSMIKKKDNKLEEEEEKSRSRSPQQYDPERSTTDSVTLSNPFASVDRLNFIEDEDSQDDGWFVSSSDNKFGSVVSGNMISEPEEVELLEPTIILTRQFRPRVKSKKKEEKRRGKEERKKIKEAKRRLRALKKEAQELSADIDSEDNILKSDDELLEEGEIMDPMVERKKLIPTRANPMNWQRNLIAAVVKKPRKDISRIRFPGDGEAATNGGMSSLRESPSTTPDREEAEYLTTPEKIDIPDNKPQTKSPPKSNVRLISTKRPAKRITTLTKASTTTTRVPPKISRIIPNSSHPTSTSIQVVAPQTSPFNVSRVTPITFNSIDITSSNVVTSTFKPKGINPFAKVISPCEVSSTQPEKKTPPPKPSTSLSTKPSSSKRVVRTKNMKKVTPLLQPLQKTSPPAAHYLDDFEAELKLLNAALSEPSTKDKKKRSTPLLDVDNDDDLFDDIDSLLGY